MGIFESASNASFWRGVDYHTEKKVVKWKATGEYTYDGIVSGSGRQEYVVHIDAEHPRKSTCDCEFAKGRRVICKHMVALYIAAKPDAFDRYMIKIKECEKELERQEQQRLNDLKKEIHKMTKKELEEKLFNAYMEIEELQRRDRWY